MRYKIETTSSYGYQETAPCSNAFRGENDEDNYPQWYVDINSLEELHSIITEKKCPVIVSSGKLEIYDAWRE